MRIVVVGDVVVDHHVYEGERSNPSQTDARGVRVVREFGGAHALTELIKQIGATHTKSREQDQQQADDAFDQSKARYEKLVAARRNPRKPERISLPPHPIEDCEVEFGLNSPKRDALPCGHHGLAIFRPYPMSHEDPDVMVWRASTLLGYGHDNPHPAESESHSSGGHCGAHRPVPKKNIEPGDIFILDDAAYMFRKSAECWLLEIAEQATWIVIKISGPVCRGDLWAELLKYREKLIVVVAAKELREEQPGISLGVSWERTIEDLAVALANDNYLQQLTHCRHLVVSFFADGALWLDNGNTENSATKAQLVYDASSIEGQWAEQTDGAVFGYLSCLVAAITKTLVADVADPKQTPDLVGALNTGLATMRNLRSEGHGRVSDEPPSGYPVERLAKEIYKPSKRFAYCTVPWQSLASETIAPLSWSIAVQSQVSQDASEMHPMPMIGLAQQVVLRGRRVLKDLPNATFGGLFTVDRAEIEALRTLRRLMKNYKKARGGDKPLSLGVFGPPGAGKSFGVKQIANEIFGKPAWLEFNLSQFSQDDLIGALHLVRDKVLEVGIPVVFWDEFDSKNYDWLQSLLAPMQDGRFQDGQVNHPIGSCVFIFAGATSHTYQQFGPSPKSESWKDFKLKKGPDFISRLDGYYNVLGPNPRQLPAGSVASDDRDDASAPIRRALLLRQFLCGGSNGRLKIEAGLLRALLTVPKYSNGARSLQKLCQSLKPKKVAGPVSRSDLCSPTQLAMFVDFPDDVPPSVDATRSEQVYRKFMQTCRESQELLDKSTVEELAEAIHEHYREDAKNQGWTVDPRFDKPYADLLPEDKEPNLAAARRIPFVLAVAGLELRKESDCRDLPPDHDARIREHIEQTKNMEIMSELEHDLWYDERYEAGWRPGEFREDDRRIHPLMIPYDELPDDEKRKDRGAVGRYIDQVATRGYRIVFTGT